MFFKNVVSSSFNLLHSSHVGRSSGEQCVQDGFFKPPFKEGEKDNKDFKDKNREEGIAEIIGGSGKDTNQQD